MDKPNMVGFRNILQIVPERLLANKQTAKKLRKPTQDGDQKTA